MPDPEPVLSAAMEDCCIIEIIQSTLVIVTPLLVKTLKAAHVPCASPIDAHTFFTPGIYSVLSYSEKPAIVKNLRGP